MPQSCYSPNLASSAFYLFPTLKEELERIQVIDDDQFFDCLQEIFRGIDQEELNGVFQAWVLQVHEISQGNRHYLR
jgi:hypothetical protein